MNFKNFIKSKSGFTLVELLIVIAIIGILSSLVVLSVSSIPASARDGKRISELNSLEAALEQYYTDNKEYPTPTSCSDPYCTDISTSATFLESSLVTNDYLKDILTDPINDSNYNYKYRIPYSASTADPSKYAIDVQLEKKTEGENIYRYCNGSAWSGYYYMGFSSYAYRKIVTNEDNEGCTTDDYGVGCCVLCYKPTWD